ncbi:MAG: TatD family hydrolase [Candidatus Aenigmarchaeota archaeon]|nr:TatD family hydrolase [Candidatus Aenigmarchaeota archaeon]
MIDTHCHLTYKGLKENCQQILEDARKEMKAIITCGFPEDADDALALSEQYPGFVYVSLGIHPTDVIEMSDDDIEKYSKFIERNKRKIIAIGEIGLDYHWITDEKQKQRTKEIFLFFLNLAKELDKPIILHSRKAEEDVLKLVIQEDVKIATFHSYTGNITLARKIIEEGFFISLNTNLPNSKNAKKIAKALPLEQLLTETDAPFLSPYPGKVNVPQNVKLVIENIAKLRQMQIEEVKEAILENCESFFNTKFS